MQIKMSKSIVTLEGSTFFDVYFIDIDEYRIELSDAYGWVIGTIDADTKKDMNIFRKNEFSKYEDTEIENEFILQNGGVIWSDEVTFFDIHKVVIKRKYIELLDEFDDIVGLINHNTIYDECAYMEYDENGQLYNTPINKLWSNKVRCF